MYNCNPPLGVLANTTSVAKGDDAGWINHLAIFSSSHSSSTTNSALDIESRCPHGGTSPFFSCKTLSMPGWCGGSRSAETILNKRRSSLYCLETISSRGCSFRSLASIALLISYRDTSISVSFPLLNVWKKENPLSITMFPWNGGCGYICGLYIPSSWGSTGSGGSSVTPSIVTGAWWQCGMEYCNPNVSIFDENHTTTSCNRSYGILRTTR